MSQVYPEPEQENPAVEQTGERTHAPEIKPPGGVRRLSYKVFGRESRSGRFLRQALRALLIALVLLALGALAVYFALYRPMQAELQQVRQKATQTASELQQAQQERDQAVQQRQNADTRAQDAQDQLTLELARVQLLRAMNSVTTSQVAVAQKDKDAALKALNTAEQTLKTARPRLEQVAGAQYSTLDALFTLAKNDLNNDLNLASGDLDRLRLELVRLDNAIK